MAANPQIEQYIRDYAASIGVDPETALRVSRAEALNVFDPTKPDLGGDERSSFGPFQLHYKGISKNMPNAGLGDEFTAATGLDARDPSTWPQQVAFSLDYAKKHGWSPWMGAKAAGVGEWAGINQSAVASAAPSAPATASVGVAAVPPADIGTQFADALIARTPHHSQLADDLSSGVGPRVSRERSTVFDGPPVVADAEAPVPDFASALSETPPPLAAVPVAAAAADDGIGLADLFKVADIGQAGVIDPLTQRPKLTTSRRTAG